MADDQTNPSNEPNDGQRTTLIAYILIFSALIAICAVYGVYYYHFRIELDYLLSDDPQIWGAYGDFIGGVLNPFLAFLALLGLLWTLDQNQKELSQATEQMKRSAKALENNNAESGERADIESTLRLIQIIDAQITRLTEYPVEVIAHGVNGGERPFKNHVFNKEVTLRCSLNNTTFCLQMSTEIKELVGTLIKYQELTKDRGVKDYHIQRILPIAKKIYEYNHETQEAMEQILPQHFPLVVTTSDGHRFE